VTSEQGACSEPNVPTASQPGNWKNYHNAFRVRSCC